MYLFFNKPGGSARGRARGARRLSMIDRGWFLPPLAPGGLGDHHQPPSPTRLHGRTSVLTLIVVLLAGTFVPDQNSSIEAETHFQRQLQALVMADNVSLIPDSKSKPQEAIHFTHLVLDVHRATPSESPQEPLCGPGRRVAEGDRDRSFVAAVWRARAC